MSESMRAATVNNDTNQSLDSKVGNRLSLLAKFLVPSRIDVALWLSVFLLLMGGVTGWCGSRSCVLNNWWGSDISYVMHWTWQITVALSFLAVGVSIAWGRADKLVCLLIVTGGVVSLVACAICFKLATPGGFAEQQYTERVLSIGGNVFRLNMLYFSTQLSTVPAISVVPSVLFFLAGFLLGWLPIAGYRKLSAYLKAKRGVGITRKNILFTVAALLVLLVGYRNIFVDQDGVSGLNFFQFFLVAGLLVVTYSVLVLLLSWSANRGLGWKTRYLIPVLLFWVPFIALIASLVFVRPLAGLAFSNAGEMFLILLVPAIVYGTYGLSLLASSAPAIEFQQRKRKRLLGLLVAPSTLVLLVLLVGFARFVSLHDLDTLVESPSQFRLAEARAAKELKSNPQISFLTLEDSEGLRKVGIVRTTWNRSSNTMLLEFDSTTPADVLSGLVGTRLQCDRIVIIGLEPHVDLSPISVGNCHVHIADSSVSVSQLSDMFANSVSFGRNVEVVSDSNSSKDAQLGTVKVIGSINALEARNCGDILKWIDADALEKHQFFIIVPEINVQSEVTSQESADESNKQKHVGSLTKRDWEQILRIADKKANVLLALPDSAFESGWQELPKEAPAFSRIRVQAAHWKDRYVKQLILNTDIGVAVDSSVGDRALLPRAALSSDFWELAYLKANRVYAPALVDELADLEKCSGVYVRDRDGNPTEVFSPYLEFPLVETSKIESLSLDPSWLVVPYSSGRRLVGKPGWIESMPNLKRLYLPVGVSFSDLMTEKPIPLTELTIHQFDLSQNSSASWLKHVPNLERLTLIGQMSLFMQTEFLEKTNLKQIHYVYEEDYEQAQCGLPINVSARRLQAAVLAKLKAQFPLAEVRVTSSSKYKIELPDSFTAHVKRIAEQARERLEAESTSEAVSEAVSEDGK